MPLRHMCWLWLLLVSSHMWWLWLFLVTCDCYDMKYGVPKYLLKRPIKSFLVIYYSKIIQYCCWDFTRWKMKIANHSCWKKITRALRALVIFFQHMWLAILIFQLVKSQLELHISRGKRENLDYFPREMREMREIRKIAKIRKFY